MQHAQGGALLVVCLALAGAGGAASPAHSVAELDESSFVQALRGHQWAVVEFYAPWCGHCKRLAPEYERAAELLASAEPSVLVAKVDATRNDVLANWFQVRGFPTIKMFHDGKVDGEEYFGERRGEAIAAWAAKRSGSVLAAVPASPVATEPPAPEQPASSGAGGDDSAPEAPPPVVSFPGPVTANVLRGEVTLRQHWQLVGFTSGGADVPQDEAVVGVLGAALAGARDDVLAIAVPEDDVHVRSVLGLDEAQGLAGSLFLCTVAEDGRGEIALVSHRFPRRLEGAQWDGPEEGAAAVDEWAAAVIERAERPPAGEGDGEDRRVLQRAFASRTSAAAGGEGSERDADGLFHVVGDTFRTALVEPIAAASATVAVVEVYAPWCEHCKRAEPEVRAAARAARDAGGDVIVAQMDGTVNEVAGVRVRGYPTVLVLCEDEGEIRVVEHGGAVTAHEVLATAAAECGEAARAAAERVMAALSGGGQKDEL